MNLNIKKLNPNAQIPTRGTASAAGYDLYACNDEPVVILPGTTELIPTGLAMEIPEGYFGAIYPRSGLATKQGLRLANDVAVIDADFRGHVQVPLYNDSAVDRTVQPGDRIAQIIFQPFLEVSLQEASSLNSTDRGAGGFGSTGV